MYKIYIDEDSYNYLRQWSEEYKRYVLDCPPVSRKFKVFCKDKIFAELSMYFTATGYGYKFSLVDNGGQLAKGKIIRTPDGKNDFGAHFETTQYFEKSAKENDVDADVYAKTVLRKFIQRHCTAFTMANAFLMYGNVVNDKEIIAAGRNSGIDKIIVFRPYQGDLYAVPVGHHRSPEGVFEVRGHFRKYKNGKIIWIDSYLKGTDKEED
jgi:hypothetical protein